MKRLLTLALLLFPASLLAQQIAPPRYFLEINNQPEISYSRGIFGGVDQDKHDYLGSADAVRETMVKRHHIPLSWFTEKREKADYILRINSEGANCRWTVLYNDRAKGEEVVVESKKVIYCQSAIKDVLNVPLDDWARRHVLK
ncbi:MAG: hypothetical protein ABSH28_20935 [Acidobacteriota bacterium]